MKKPSNTLRKNKGRDAQNLPEVLHTSAKFLQYSGKALFIRGRQDPGSERKGLS